MQDHLKPPPVRPAGQDGGREPQEAQEVQEGAPVAPVSSWSPWSPIRNRAWSGLTGSRRQAQDARGQSGAGRTSGGSCEGRSR